MAPLFSRITASRDVGIALCCEKRREEREQEGKKKEREVRHTHTHTSESRTTLHAFRVTCPYVLLYDRGNAGAMLNVPRGYSHPRTRPYERSCIFGDLSGPLAALAFSTTLRLATAAAAAATKNPVAGSSRYHEPPWVLREPYVSATAAEIFKWFLDP